MKKFFFIFICAALPYEQVHSQDSTLVYQVNLRGALAGSSTPFWMHSNTNGVIPVNGSFLSGQLALYKKYNTSIKRFAQWSAGLELITNTGNSNNIFFTDLYLAGKLGPVELSLGQKKEYMGLADSTLSSGGVAMGNNYRPYPKIQISAPKYFNVIPGSDILAFKFSYSDGILGPAQVQYGNVSEVSRIYLHQKSVYLRLGRKDFIFNLYAGFNHQVIWGGEDKIFSGGLSRGAAYKYVVFGKPWSGSRVGNHFGTIDLALEAKTNMGVFFLYRQSIYEDGSLIKFSNIADGLNGLRFKRTNIDKSDRTFKINTALIEFVYTKNQGGAVFNYNAGIFGNDNYFNHYIYTQGWSYRGRSLGTPLISPQSLIKNNLPHNSRDFTINNRISAFHTGFYATWMDYQLMFKGTYSKNYGNYNLPLKPSLNQTSFIISLEKSIPIWKKSIVSVSLATDIGQLYPNTAAASVGWKKIGFIR
ncbi:capsule assembly Wzi family protein [Dyadobacter sp. NIV53]|uniref:capsule assembly Wzi family protein n=1 Tax=Dyadobacter sp. NIV53 TaxID=2861765 RepID=UPI001C87DE78|nr:capsule assembly Wzi family protein [Dyadobacter sp. NIV53]